MIKSEPDTVAIVTKPDRAAGEEQGRDGRGTQQSAANQLMDRQ